MKVLRPSFPAGLLALISLFVLLGWVSDAGAYRSITSSENSVIVNVKPVELAPGQPAKFEVGMNTHSVNLLQDMVAVSTLTDDHGRTYQPVKWQGSGPGGHHRRGVLEFPALEESVKSVKLVIKDVSDVPQRMFEWKIEN